ncbi:unnamed protein product [Brassicogethes aeneus]|uniref:Uncharacterized protein n=1 Tax=Brassicogethes aeneus TaxID=1431903 RepID=A0A9P0FKE2_BRAAE|nr:unnamed protein product [Brassicogethes aeneus]
MRLNWPDIRNLVKYEDFDRALVDNEIVAWASIREIIVGLLGKHPSPNYEGSLRRMLDVFFQNWSEYVAKNSFPSSPFGLLQSTEENKNEKQENKGEEVEGMEFFSEESKNENEEQGNKGEEVEGMEFFSNESDYSMF